MPKRHAKPHYAWFILAACCALQGGTLGLIQNSCGIFYRPICDELGLELSSITLYTTIRGLTSCAALMFATRILKTKNIRVTLTLSTVVFALSNISMGSFSYPWQWYTAGAVQGVASSFLAVVTVPIILSNWFAQKRGFAVGFASAFSGVLGMIANPLGSALISTVGWRACYLIFGLISLAMILPFTLFVFYFKPGDMGYDAYGAAMPAESQCSRPLAAGKQSPRLQNAALSILFALQMIAMFCSGFTTHLSPLGLSAGLPPTAAAALASFAMAGNMAGKFVLGALSDRFGVARTTLISFFLPLTGFLLLLRGGAPVYAASFLIGIAIPAAAVMLPLLIRSVSTAERFEETYSTITLFGSITYSLAGTAIGLLYDFRGNYRAAMLLCIALLGAGTLLVSALPQTKRGISRSKRA